MKLLGLLLVIICVTAIELYVFQWAWSVTMVPLFKLPEITLWETFAFLYIIGQFRPKKGYSQFLKD